MCKAYRFVLTLVLGLSWSGVHAAGICQASSVATLDACVAGVAASTYDSIQITQDIVCPSTGSACAYHLNGVGSVARPIAIFGSSPSITVYRNPTVIFLSIENSNNVTVRDLRIHDVVKRNLDYQDCNFYRPITPVLAIGQDMASGYGQSTSIFVSNLDIDTGEPDAIDLGRSDDVNILDSKISGAGHFGIWSSNQFQKSNIRIFDNHISGVGANAILLAAATNSWINGNTINGNHHANPFCVNGVHSGGGQMVVEQGVANLTIQSNYIYDGGNLNVSGIEFADGSGAPISGVTIYANQIHDNANGGIHMNLAAPQSSVSGVVIRENSFYGNGPIQVYVSGHKDVDIYDNYYTQNLSISPRANFAGTAKTCALNGGSTCNLTINWQTQLAPGARVIVDGNGLFSVNPSGSQAAPWIGAPGDVFEITSTAVGSGNEPIARIYVKGQ